MKKSIFVLLLCLCLCYSLIAMPQSEAASDSENQADDDTLNSIQSDSTDVEHSSQQEVLMNDLGFEFDIFDVDGKTLTITFIGHGTLMMEYGTITIHIDPVSREADYSKMPKADLILITHTHQDHLDKSAIKKIKTESTTIVGNEASIAVLKEGIALKNGESETINNILIHAIPAYNTTSGRDKFHPKGRDNGYIIDLNGTRVYIAGDTEDIPEMKTLKNIAIAFLPMNQPYTMTPKQVAEAAKSFRPEILYPYHFGNTDSTTLRELLKDEGDIQVRIRKLD